MRQAESHGRCGGKQNFRSTKHPILRAAGAKSAHVKD
jgi:hypothetical protein